MGCFQVDEEEIKQFVKSLVETNDLELNCGKIIIVNAIKGRYKSDDELALAFIMTGIYAERKLNKVQL